MHENLIMRVKKNKLHHYKRAEGESSDGVQPGLERSTKEPSDYKTVFNSEMATANLLGQSQELNEIS